MRPFITPAGFLIKTLPLLFLTINGCAHLNTSSDTASRISATHLVSAKGYVPDAATAIAIAEAVWKPLFGEKAVRENRPFHANLDGEVWVVMGTVPVLPREKGAPPPVGGTTEAYIDRLSGKILAIIGGE